MSGNHANTLTTTSWGTLNRDHPAELLLDSRPPEITCYVTNDTPVLSSVTEFEIICCTAREDEQTTWLLLWPLKREEKLREPGCNSPQPGFRPWQLHRLGWDDASVSHVLGQPWGSKPCPPQHRRPALDTYCAREVNLGCTKSLKIWDWELRYHGIT